MGRQWAGGQDPGSSLELLASCLPPGSLVFSSYRVSPERTLKVGRGREQLVNVFDRVLRMAASLGGSGDTWGEQRGGRSGLAAVTWAEKVREASPCGINLALSGVDALWAGMRHRCTLRLIQGHDSQHNADKQT